MHPQNTELDLRVLILAPRGRDAKLVEAMLCRAGIEAQAADSIDVLCNQMQAGAGAVVITEEAVHREFLIKLCEVLQRQPPWSDLPLILLTTGGEEDSVKTWQLVNRLDPVGNVSLLERPLRSITLISAVQVALRARKRQYEVRSLHEGLERRVAERTVELERLNQEAEGFSYSISHDLRAPLRAIAGTSRMILEDHPTGLPDDVLDNLERQVVAANRLAQLIDDLLKLSRLSREQMRPKPFDFSKLAQDVGIELRGDHQVRGCKFEIQPGLTAYGDPLLVRFVLLNLMQNACKFSPDGGTVTVGRTEDSVYFVSDQGIGFDMRYVAKLFRPFERLVTEQEFSGTGIGLANVRRIVERHSGRVWAESAPGEGATFSFTLPEKAA